MRLFTHVMLVEFRQSWFAMIIKYQDGFDHVQLESSCGRASTVQAEIAIINKFTNNRNLTLTRTAER